MASCVTARLKRSFLNEELKFPNILPKEERVTTLIQDCHSRCAHGARWATLDEFHSGGYWTNGNSAVQSVIFKCILCSRLRGRVALPKMAELPAHRPSDFPPFTYCRVECLGPSWSSCAEMKSNVMVQCLCAWEAG